MRPLDIALYAGSAVLTAAGLTFIKLDLAGGLPPSVAAIDPWQAAKLIGALVIYLTGMGLWLAAMGRNPLSTAYPIGIGLSLAAAALAAVLILGEPLGPLRIAGIAAILLGAVAIARSPARH